MTQNDNKFWNDVYDTTATVGYFAAYYNLIVGCIIGIILIIIGIAITFVTFVGLIIFLFGVIIIAGSWYWWYIATTYKPMAAANGVGAMINLAF